METAKSQTRKALLELAKKYADPRVAFRTLYIWFFGVLIVYVVFVLGSNFGVRRSDDGWTERALKLSSIGFLSVEYNDAYLERRFRRDRINEIKDFTEAELSAKREETFDDRRAALLDAALIACRLNRAEGLPPPPILAGLALGEIVTAESNGARAITCSSGHVGDAIAPKAEAIRRADLGQLVAWFRKERGDRYPAERLDFADPETCAAYRISDGTLTGEAIAVLAAQACNEAAVVADVRDELLALEDALSFSFLKSDGFWWIVHLIVWSLFGLIANTLAGLMKSLKDDAYNGALFVFFYPKLILSPLIAIVVVALVVYGVFQTPINLAHQPLFLAFSFFSGYASERFNGLLHDAMHGILASQSFDQDKFEQGMKAQRIGFRPAPKLIDKPATVSDFEKNARAMARHVIGQDIAEHVRKADASGAKA